MEFGCTVKSKMQAFKFNAFVEVDDYPFEYAFGRKDRHWKLYKNQYPMY